MPVIFSKMLYKKSTSCPEMQLLGLQHQLSGHIQNVRNWMMTGVGIGTLIGDRDYLKLETWNLELET